MRSNRLAWAACLLLVGAGGCACPAPATPPPPLSARQIYEQHHELVAEDRPNLLITRRPSFRSQYYLELAAALQALPQADAEKQLQAWAKSGSYDEEVIILCCMLWVGELGEPLERVAGAKNSGFSFAAVNLGNRYGIGATKAEDWPDWPLKIVDGVPFLIAAKFAGALSRPVTPNVQSGPSMAQNYLTYCLTRGRWTTQRYRTVDLAARQQVLDKLLKSSVWNRKLLDQEVKVLEYEITDEVPSEPLYYSKNGRLDE